MKGPSFLICVTILCSIPIIPNPSQSKQIPISDKVTFDLSHKWRKPHWHSQETPFKFATPLIISGVLCFFAASISSAGGIGGGGLFIPILTIVAGFDLKMASGFSAFMVTGGSLANVICNFLKTSPKSRGKSLVDFDIALLSEPCMLLGVSVGVICNVVFPEWLITAMFVVFLSWCTFKTCRNGILCWRSETEEVRAIGSDNLDDIGSAANGHSDEIGAVETTKEPLLGRKGNGNLGIPWMKLGQLVLIWMSFFLVYLLRGNRYGEGIATVEPCGVAYWILSSIQIPLAIVFSAWILSGKDSLHDQSSQQMTDTGTCSRISNKLIFPMMALLAGTLGGVFGIGGGMLISPLLLQVGISPEVTAATCSFMVFFSSTMSAFQYLFLGMENTDVALIFSLICFIASLTGLVIVQRAIEFYGRASLIVFSVATVMALSTVLLTSDGALRVYRDYTAGQYMGFNFPC